MLLAPAPPRTSVAFGQLVRFIVVGGTGLLVNMAVIIACNRFGPTSHSVAMELPATTYTVRTYHVYATIAFLIANLWNFQLNRTWTFKTTLHARWISEYVPFLVTGLVGLIANLALLTVLLHQGSPFELSARILDDSSGFRTRLYWAQLIAIAIVTPLSFLVNKYWTFTAVRGAVPAPDRL